MALKKSVEILGSQLHHLLMVQKNLVCVGGASVNSYDSISAYVFFFFSGNVANPSSLEGNKTATKLAPSYRSSFTSRIVVTTFVGKKQPLTQKKQGTSEKTPALK